VGYHRHIYKCIREIKGALKIFSKAKSKQESSKSEYFFKGDSRAVALYNKKNPAKSGKFKGFT